MGADRRPPGSLQGALTGATVDPDVSAAAATGLDEESPTLIHRASRAAFWNVLLLPLIAVLNLAFAMLVRRWFDLSSGIYDQVIGLLATALFYSSLGIPTSLTKFLPEIEEAEGRGAVAAFLGRAATARMALVALVLVPINVWAAELAAWFDLGEEPIVYVRLLSGLVVFRALFELAVKVHHAFLEHLEANLLTLVQAGFDLLLVAAALGLGAGMPGAIAALVASAALTAGAGLFTAGRSLARLPATPARLAPAAELAADAGGASGGEDRRSDGRDAEAAAASDTVDSRGHGPAAPETLDDGRRFLRFTTFTWVFELSLYFASAGFAATALGPVVGSAGVALFIAGFKLAFMTVGLVVTSFRGLYRPVFTRLRNRGDPEQLRRGFDAISKAQVVLLFPAGVGLAIMAGDYLPLLFDVEFAAAVPIARILVAAMFAETAFNLGVIVLSIDERYRLVIAIQSLLLLAAPAFVLAAVHASLPWAASIFGGARLAVAVAGYLLCRRLYGFRFPWAFTARVGAVSAVMGAVLVALRWGWPTSVLEATVLTLLGVAIYAVGMRVARVLGPAETELLHRTGLPGRRWLLAWLAPRGR